MQITCYNAFSKKPNSTKVPTSGGTSKTCTLKQPTSIIKPVFLLTGDVFTYDYIQWGNRWYFVDDVISVHNNLTEYHCTVDPAATWKLEIGASSQYVTRAASASDGSILDMAYPCKTGPSTDVVQLSSLQSDFVSGSAGFYVVGVIGAIISSGVTSNAIQYYAMDRSTFKSFLNYLFNTVWLDNTQADITLDTQKQLMNPMQYIASCHWYPMPFPDAGMGSSELINFGWWQSTVSALLLSDREIIYQQPDTVLASHPDIARGTYLNSSAYTKRSLTVYNFGTIDLPSDIMITNTTLHLDLDVDLFAGSGVLSVMCAGVRIAQLTGEVGCSVPLAQISAGLLGTLSKKAADVGDLIKEYMPKFEGAVMGIYSSIANAISAKSAKVNVIGGQGSNSIYQFTPTVLSEFYRPVDEDVLQIGRPLCQVKQINTLSGYIKCEGADLGIPGTSYERDAIVNMLNNGFYYE